MTDLLVEVIPLTRGWRLARSDASRYSHPGEIDWSEGSSDAVVPGTVASTLIGSSWDGKAPNLDYDDYDWWYQCDFDHDLETVFADLVFAGLATIAQVWLNDECVLETRNMFRSYRIDVSSKLESQNTLTIVFRSVNLDLQQKRARPRWKTNLVRNQQLRWIRTTLLGRIPGWTPAIAPVGPWRHVSLECSAKVCIGELSVMPSMRGSQAEIRVRASLSCIDLKSPVSSASLAILGDTHDIDVQHSAGGLAIDARIVIGDAPLWSPQSPVLHDYQLSMLIDGVATTLGAGRLGFREVQVDRSDGRLCFRINGKDIFCRGACWTTNDIISLHGKDQELRNCLTKFREANGNMIRVGGTMVYESDLFYSLCDELGIIIWQDFMFANMDYPSNDNTFLQDATAEIDEQIRRLTRHPSVVAFCGNSEVEQQSAMFGMTADLWRNELFYEVAPDRLEASCPGALYFASSPSEGALPFQVSTGPSHYFGVGAYKQPLASVETARVRFTSECLAFSNVPSDQSLIEHFQSATPASHDPRWKQGVPRDSAAGWDFEDIRDHYIKELYRIDPVELRYADRERYIAISQVVTGEVMEHAFNYWRSPDSGCSGALVWQLKDIVPGAGWGFIDTNGRAKPLFYFLKRCWNDQNIAILDRGMDGLELRASNESGGPHDVHINVKLLQHSTTVIASEDCRLPAPDSGRSTILLDEVLGRFFDVAYRHRFGAPKHDVVVATVLDGDGHQRLTRCFFPGGHNIRTLDSVDIDIRCRSDADNIRIEIRSGSFLQHVKLYSRTHDFDDNYFHLSPGSMKIVLARPVEQTDRPFRGILSALNLGNPIAFN